MTGTTFNPGAEWNPDPSRPVVYCVQSWFHPAKGGPYLKWLEEKHMAEVLAHPGIISARRTMLDQTDDNGWWCCLLMYEMENRSVLDSYLDSPAREVFWNELEGFGDIHYSERFWGETDLELYK